MSCIPDGAHHRVASSQAVAALGSGSCPRMRSPASSRWCRARRARTCDGRGPGPRRGCGCGRCSRRADYHATHHENASFRFEAEARGDTVTCGRTTARPRSCASPPGTTITRPSGIANFGSRPRRRAGSTARRIASPGIFTLICPATLAFGVEDIADGAFGERSAGLDRAADCYLVARGTGRTIIAGYPWFTDWGRDTFIALRGLCLATGRLDDAREILSSGRARCRRACCRTASPTRRAPEYNAVDASLWYVDRRARAAAARRGRARRSRAPIATRCERRRQIVDGYARARATGSAWTPTACSPRRARRAADVDGRQGRRPGRHAADRQAGRDPGAVAERARDRRRVTGSASVRAGAGGVRASASGTRRRLPLRRRGRAITCRARSIARCGPNQIFAVGGLPFPLLDGDRARAVVDALERALRRRGPRSLSPATRATRPLPGRPARARRAVSSGHRSGRGSPGAFVEAWVRVRGDRGEARRRVLRAAARASSSPARPLSEICRRRSAARRRAGCPFQAWSLAGCSGSISLHQISVMPRSPSARRGPSAPAAIAANRSAAQPTSAAR